MDDILKLVVDKKDEMTYEEATKYFGEKLTITAKEFTTLQAEYRTLAFTVSGYSNLNTLKAFQAKLTEAIANGTTLSQFRTEMAEYVGAKELPWYNAENIFRTNVQTAYNVGAYQDMTLPAVLRARPYWMYDAVGDSRTRPEHLAMDGKVFPADSPVWDTWYPPNGFRCRCSVVTLSQRQLDRMGLAVSDAPPEWAKVDDGFASNPAKVQFTPDLTEFPQTLVDAYQQRNQQAPR